MSQAGPGAGSSHQSSTGQATGSGNQTNWDRQGARPKHQTTTSSTMEDTSGERCQFPLNYEESWDNVKVEIRMKGKLVSYDFGGDLILPFTVQYLCSSINLKHEVEILTDSLTLKEIKENLLVLEKKFDKTGDQADQLGDEVCTILKTVFEGNSVYQLSEKDFCLLVDYASKSPEVKCYHYKGQMYICGKKTSIKGIRAKLQYPREEVQIHKDAMLLFREYNYFKKLSSNGVTIIPMNDEAVVVTCSDIGIMQEAVDSLRKELAEVDSLHLQGVIVTKDLEQKFIDRQVKVIVSETGQVKLIIRKNQKPEIEEMMKEWISAMFGQNAQASNNNQPKPHDVNQSDEDQGPELPKKLRQNKQVDTDEEIWTCDSGLCTYLKQQGSNIIESLQKKQNVTIQIGQDEIKFRGSKDNIHTAVLGLKLEVMSSTVEVPNDGGSLCQWATSSAGKEALDRITASQGCGWTLMPCSQAYSCSTHETRKGVLPLATWTLTTPRLIKHRLSVCVVKDFKQTDLEEIIIPVYTDQTPLNNFAGLQLGELTPSFKKQMKHGEWLRKWAESPNRKIMLIALAEKMIENQMVHIALPDNNGLKIYFNEMFQKLNTPTYAFVIPKNSEFTEWERLMKNLIVAYHRQFRKSSASQEMLLSCQSMCDAGNLLDLLHNLCCKKMFGTFDTSQPVLMSKKINFNIEQISILELKADCIVVMVSRGLDLSKGAIPAQILKMFGPGFQDHINKTHPDPMADGESFFLTLPEIMPSGIKSIIMGFLPKFTNKGHIETLRKFVQGCLHTAASNRCSSLGFPAIGTGYLEYPQESVTTAMFDTVEQFSREAMCSGLDSVIVAIVNQTDTMRKRLIREEERRKLVATNKFRPCQAFFFLETMASKDVHVRVVTNDSLVWPLPPEWVIVDININKGQDHSLELLYLSDNTKWNDRIEVRCPDTAQKLKDQMKQVILSCEKRRITCLAIYSPSGFTLSISWQVEMITNVLYEASPRFLINVMIITPDESGLKNCDLLLPRTDNSYFTSLWTKLPVWQKKMMEPCHRMVVFGQEKNVTQAVRSLKDAVKSNNGSDDDRYNQIQNSSLPSGSEFNNPNPGSNSAIPSFNRQQLPGEESPVQTGDIKSNEDAGEYVDLKHTDAPSSSGMDKDSVLTPLASLTSREETVDVYEDDVESLFADGEAVSVINATILKQMNDSGQEGLTIDDIEKKYSVKFQKWKGESIFCGSLDAVAEVEQFLWKYPTLGAFPNENLDDKQSKQKNQSASIADSVDREAEGKKPVVVYFGLKIFAYRQDILQTKVEAIVRPTNEYMAGSDAAGAVMVKECEQSHNNEGKLQGTEYRVTKAGSLDFSRIIHVHVNCLKPASMLKTAILNCLKKAEESGVKTLAIPLIGTGCTGQDIKLCAVQYLHAVKEFVRDRDGESLTEIHFVDRDQEKISSLLKELETLPGSNGDKTQGMNGNIKQGSQKDNRPGLEGVDKNEGQCSQTRDKQNIPFNTSEINIPNHNVTLYISYCDITRISTDAIICPQDEKFKSKGMIADTIWELSGESHKYCLENEGKKKHTICDTVPIAPEGQMTCRTVIYAVSPHWTREYTKKNQDFERDITKTVKKCLQHVHHRNYNSVAFPLLGTSDDEEARPTPLETCCRAMITGIIQFCKAKLSHKSDPLQIHMVSNDEAVVLSFEQELSKQMSSYDRMSVGYNLTSPTSCCRDQDGNTLPETPV